jgi:pyruvate/2-oxoglutarate dehydrogenase complex dihydrolipoamide acyltransferase (E2) component
MKVLVAAVLVASSVEAFQLSSPAAAKNKLSFGSSLSSATSSTSLNAGSQITMPALSSTMKEGRVVSWLKSEGDEIEAGEAIMVVESDKADMDVEAFEDGFLAKIIVQEGQIAPVGQAVAYIASSAEEIDSVIASFGGGGAVAAAAAPAAANAGTYLTLSGTIVIVMINRSQAPKMIKWVDGSHTFYIAPSLLFFSILQHQLPPPVRVRPSPIANSAKSTCPPCPVP